MGKSIKIAESILLEPAGLDQRELSKILDSILGHHIDHADLYFQACWQEGWSLENGIIKEGSFNIDRGVGVRAISEEKTGFAYSDDIILPALQDAARAARAISHKGGEGQIKTISTIDLQQYYSAINPLDSLDRPAKIALLQKVDHFARRIDPRIKEVSINMAGLHEIVLVMASDGSLSADVRPLVRMNVSVIAEEGNKREQGYYGGGGRTDYTMFDDTCLKEFAEEAVRQAILNLSAKEAPAGTMPVVLGPGWPGVLLHEAVGHGLEGDFNRKGTSVYSGRIGERVASPGCTVIDNGTMPGRRGSLNIDDEGTQTQSTVLIENGILKTYMQDKLNARLMNMKPTGNGRRESYAHLPMPRMTNTYMLSGSYMPEEIIKRVEKGLYAVNFSGGQVDITSGKFVFSTSEAYLIEKGKITTPVKGATLIGNGPDVLMKVSMVGNDLELDSGIGVCGKEGQSVPVGVGQPTLLVDELTVGGTTVNKKD